MGFQVAHHSGIPFTLCTPVDSLQVLDLKKAGCGGAVSTTLTRPVVKALPLPKCSQRFLPLHTLSHPFIPLHPFYLFAPQTTSCRCWSCWTLK